MRDHRLKYLYVRKFRDLERSKLEFSPTKNVLLGKNASGKTTLLRMIAAVIRGDLRSFSHEPYDIEWRIESSTGSFTCRTITKARQVDVQPALPQLALKQSPLTVNYKVSVEHSGGSFELTADSGAGVQIDITKPERYTTRHDKVPVDVSSTLWDLVINIYRELLMDPKCSSVALNIIKYVTRPGHGARRFDESLEIFGNQFGRTAHYDSIAHSISSHVELYLDGENDLKTSFEHYTPADVTNAAVREIRTDATKDDVRIPASRLTFLKVLVEAFGYQSGTFRADIRRSGQPTPGEVYIATLENYRLFFRRQDGSTISEQELSYGQKRLTAFFFELYSEDSPFVADELVNGLHHEWIELCLGALGNRQAFLTSQNPLLLDCLGFESQEDVKSTFVICGGSFDEESYLQWQNIEEADAKAFYSSYKVGIQHVSEILRAKGLW